MELSRKVNYLLVHSNYIKAVVFVNRALKPIAPRRFYGNIELRVCEILRRDSKLTVRKSAMIQKEFESSEIERTELS